MRPHLKPRQLLAAAAAGGGGGGGSRSSRWGDLETKLTELYAGTEVPAAAVADRQATALRKYDADSLAKLDKLETSRKATEKAEAEEKARLDKAELEARSPMEGKDWAGHLQSSTEKIVSERNALQGSQS